MLFGLDNLVGLIGSKDFLDFLAHGIPIPKSLGLTV
jgi:hypothetical protein